MYIGPLCSPRIPIFQGFSRDTSPKRLIIPFCPGTNNLFYNFQKTVAYKHWLNALGQFTWKDRGGDEENRAGM